jgi:hypothetical protein
MVENRWQPFMYFWVEIHQTLLNASLSWKDSRVLVELLEYPNLELTKHLVEKMVE